MELQILFDTILIIIKKLAELAEIVIAICAVYALRQIKIAKEDISIRSKRESITLSIEQIEYFRSRIIFNIDKIADVLLDKLKTDKQLANSINNYFYPKIKLKNFDLEEAKQENLEIKVGERNVFVANLEISSLVSDTANMVEYFSLTFTSGVADEQIAFECIGDIFCDFVIQNYSFYCKHREDSYSTAFNSTIKLYNVWKSKTKQKELDKKEDTLNKEKYMAEIEKPEELKKPIGIL